MSRTGRFLTAEWRWLAMTNHVVDPALLLPRLPAGLELDLFEGLALVSLVGFRFLDTRLFGVAVPFHRDFDEVNLRFYVRREVDGEERRAVTFVKEVVPRWLIASIARVAYNEPYVALPMQSEVRTGDADASTRARYAWTSRAGDHHIEVLARGDLRLPATGSDDAFITEHYWGYTRQRDGGTIEYRVTHPTWRLRAAATASVEGDMAAFYGPEWREVLSAPPVSAYLAEGSAVTVFRPRRIT